MFIGFGRSHAIHGELSYNIVPFKTIRQYLIYRGHFNFNIWFINIFGNIGVFAPFGLLLPLLFVKLRSFVRLLCGFVLSLFMLELLQMLTETGTFDVDDIILNSIGAILGFACYKLLVYKPPG